jgi:hypothetical protein
MSQKSFTTRKEPIEFDIDDEVFYLKSSIPAGKITELSRLAGEMQAMATAPVDDASDALAPVMKLLAEIFESESFDRFIKRYNGEYSPIDIGTFYEILAWVIGEALGKGITLPQST